MTREFRTCLRVPAPLLAVLSNSLSHIPLALNILDLIGVGLRDQGSVLRWIMGGMS